MRESDLEDGTDIVGRAPMFAADGLKVDGLVDGVVDGVVDGLVDGLVDGVF